MPDSTGSWFQATKRDTAGVSTGKVSDEPLTFAGGMVQATAGAASSAMIAAASAGTITRTITFSILASADTGVYLRAAAAATSSNYLIQPGGSLTITSLEAINGIRAGSADVTVFIAAGVKT